MLSATVLSLQNTFWGLFITVYINIGSTQEYDMCFVIQTKDDLKKSFFLTFINRSRLCISLCSIKKQQHLTLSDATPTSSHPDTPLTPGNTLRCQLITPGSTRDSEKVFHWYEVQKPVILCSRTDALEHLNTGALDSEGEWVSGELKYSTDSDMMEPIVQTHTFTEPFVNDDENCVVFMKTIILGLFYLRFLILL